jgi:uncharacterized protein (TIGR02246 family)
MSITTTLGQLSEQDISALRSVVDELVQACLNKDWDKFASLLTEDAVWMPPDQPIVVGRKAVRVWVETFPSIKAFRSALESAEGRGDLAWARGTFDMTVEPAPGQRLAMKGKWSGACRRQSDGTWLLASDIWNTDHPISAA